MLHNIPTRVKKMKFKNLLFGFYVSFMYSGSKEANGISHYICSQQFFCVPEGSNAYYIRLSNDESASQYRISCEDGAPGLPTFIDFENLENGERHRCIGMPIPSTDKMPDQATVLSPICQILGGLRKNNREEMIADPERSVHFMVKRIPCDKIDLNKVKSYIQLCLYPLTWFARSDKVVRRIRELMKQGPISIVLKEPKAPSATDTQIIFIVEFLLGAKKRGFGVTVYKDTIKIFDIRKAGEEKEFKSHEVPMSQSSLESALYNLNIVSQVKNLDIAAKLSQLKVLNDRLIYMMFCMSLIPPSGERKEAHAVFFSQSSVNGHDADSESYDEDSGEEQGKTKR